MNIENVIITQEELRNPEQIPEMVKFVNLGGFFSDSDKKISLSRFPDSKIFIHDGHHRICAIYLAGRRHLSKTEYIITDWTYEDYLEINFVNNWITPFHPMYEIRIPDLSDFRNSVNNSSDKVDFINCNKHLYAKPRKISKISELIIRLVFPTV